MTASSTSSTQKKADPTRVAQERCMIGMAVCAVLGVVLMTMLPKAFAGLVMVLVTSGTIWLMFGFGADRPRK